ncbi:MAG TPA: DUF4231 domain-containing protein [Mucilaginibacter sp.]|jgi:hypothetical protein|nr:DUF4231 domain-containing protein [Mucilaginibacter sp.]
MEPNDNSENKSEETINQATEIPHEQADEQKINWRKISKNGVLIGQFLLIIFILSLVTLLSGKFIPYPYSICAIGFEISLACIAIFSIIRMNTFKPAKKYDFSKLNITGGQLMLLLQNITYDIGVYEEASSYYFNGVRFYKYSTIILAGISTVILGLDTGNNSTNTVFAGIKYSAFAKDVALIIGAIITVSTSLMSYWNIEKYWLTNKTIANKLRALKIEIENDHMRYTLKSGSKKLQKRFEKYVDIKADFYKYWDGALAVRGAQQSQGTAR